MTRTGTQQNGLHAYPETGYCSPFTALSAEEAAHCRDQFLAYWEANIGRFAGKLPRERFSLTVDTHLSLTWVSELALNPAVLDAVEQVLGPDILVWNTHWFPKFPGDNSYVSWHQDAAYWGLTPPLVTTAWIALTSSTPDNGCLQVLPGSHRDSLPQRETYAADNMLSRGQEISVQLDESRVVPLPLSPGEFSLHHIGIAHGSGPNRSDQARIGVAVRYVAPSVVQQGAARDMVLLARGADRYGHFDVVAPPERDWGFDEMSPQKQALQRKLDNNATGGGKSA